MDASRRARLRAVVLAIVVVVHGWLAAPLPHKVSEQRIRAPESREELRRWHAVLDGLGVQITEDALGELVVTWSTWIGESRQATIRPIKPLLKLTGTGQGWALFAVPDTHPSRLEIHARVGREWKLVYRRLDPTATMLSAELGFRRMRGAYESGGVDGPYGQVARWAAERVLAAMPEADAVRVRIVRTHSTRPGARRDGKAQIRQVQIVERS